MEKLPCSVLEEIWSYPSCLKFQIENWSVPGCRGTKIWSSCAFDIFSKSLIISSLCWSVLGSWTSQGSMPPRKTKLQTKRAAVRRWEWATFCNWGQRLLTASVFLYNWLWGGRKVGLYFTARFCLSRIKYGGRGASQCNITKRSKLWNNCPLSNTQGEGTEWQDKKTKCRN